MAARAPFAPPELPGFRFVRPLGTGGFSDVSVYEQLLPHRTVAVKVLFADLGASGLASFTSEANLMARLSTHPFIVTIHDAGLAPDGRPYLVMEYCSRPNLAERYRAAPLSVGDALRIGVQLASAVETAHRAGILHRDIKPGNVLTNDYGYPALTDFGIAAAADAAPTGREGAGSDLEASTCGSAGLSVPWSPPEMFFDVPEHDARSDVFSLAATLHTVLAGRTPFEIPTGPNTHVDLMSRIERGQVTPLTRDDAPETLVAVLNRGMSARPEGRYASALEFGRALQRVELELGFAPTTLEIAAQQEKIVVAAPHGEVSHVTEVPDFEISFSPPPALGLDVPDGDRDVVANIAPPPALSLELPDGSRELLDAVLLVGRAPSVPPGAPESRLVRIEGDGDISRNHVRVAVEGGTVIVTDLGSRNGTIVRTAGRPAQKLREGEPTPVLVGTVIEFGGGLELIVRGG
ncbi:MAG TPA: FHA domain-containing serine/threonine-protein kinase [Pseudolysinimonas sp.]|nr:FHA domain-containing serine/threonine-protein kinase [Pseudolysinimonas sp.]